MRAKERERERERKRKKEKTGQKQEIMKKQKHTNKNTPTTKWCVCVRVRYLVPGGIFFFFYFLYFLLERTNERCCRSATNSNNKFPVGTINSPWVGEIRDNLVQRRGPARTLVVVHGTTAVHRQSTCTASGHLSCSYCVKLPLYRSELFWGAVVVWKSSRTDR